MKKIILLFSAAILIISCESEAEHKNKDIGEILSGSNKGSTYSLGSMEDAQLAVSYTHLTLPTKA